MMASHTDELPNADEAAAAWLVAHDRGMTDGESLEFAAWLGRSEANREAWRLARAMWESFEEEPDALLASIRESALALRPSPVRRASVWAIAAAAAVLAVVGAGTWIERNPARAPITASARIYSAGARPVDVALADGSHVFLDARSRIAVNETRARRDVALQAGQAFFEVAHDAARPFVVASDGRTVTATGTAFAVSKDTRGLSVVLAQGRVRVDFPGRPGERVDLVPGQQYRVIGEGRATVDEVDVEAALGWRDGYLSLHDITVREALGRMDLASPPRVVIGDVAVGDLRVSGRFRSGDPAAFAESLSALYSVRIVRMPSGQLKILSRDPVERRHRRFGE